jgi:hypothetical protein
MTLSLPLPRRVLPFKTEFLICTSICGFLCYHCNGKSCRVQEVSDLGRQIKVIKHYFFMTAVSILYHIRKFQRVILSSWLHSKRVSEYLPTGRSLYHKIYVCVEFMEIIAILFSLGDYFVNIYSSEQNFHDFTVHLVAYLRGPNLIFCTVYS